MRTELASKHPGEELQADPPIRLWVRTSSSGAYRDRLSVRVISGAAMSARRKDKESRRPAAGRRERRMLRRTASRSGLALFRPKALRDWYGVEFQPMVDQPITEPSGDLLLQPLNLGTPELDDGAGFQVNQVIMMRLRRSLVPGMAIAEFMPLNNALRFEAPDRPINSGERDMRALRRYAAVQFEHVRMIFGLRENPGDQAALIG